MFVIGGLAASYLLHCSGFTGITASCWQPGWLPRRNECRTRRGCQLRDGIPRLKIVESSVNLRDQSLVGGQSNSDALKEVWLCDLR